jgi:hypothetical protein
MEATGNNHWLVDLVAELNSAFALIEVQRPGNADLSGLG